MNVRSRIFSTLSFASVFLISAAFALAQADPAKAAEANYEATLHVLVGSAQGGPGEALPASLSGVARQVRSDLGTANLKLINTYLGRMSNTGNLEYKGVSNAYVQEQQPGNPSFLDWQLVGLRTLQNSTGQNVYQFQRFRFGARVPVRIGTFQEEKTPAPVNYEAIGLTLDRMSVRENVPTLVGTLTQPKTDGTLFLVLTVKNVDK